MQKACRKTCRKPKVLDFQGFSAFYSAYSVYAEMYRKNEVLTAKIVPTGGAGRRGWWGGFFCICRKCRKKLLKCLIFNGLLYSAILSASFLHPFCNA
jgi:hypothetical protein